mmetsp:Transcript_10542/g.17193  ORF Transcript_10542/g.17193 Transcript_10542/m.17193 type:complete len:448 (-) Transcript_10542:216-1559(-)
MTTASRLAIGWLLLQYTAIAATAFSANNIADTTSRIQPTFGLRRHAQYFGSSSTTTTRHVKQPSPTTALLATRGGDNSADDEDDNNNLRTVLVTGGTGYIGSHTCLELLNTGRYRVVVIDNLENSSEESLNRVQELLKDDENQNLDMEDRLHFRNCDIRDGPGLKSVLEEFPSITSCIHFAGLKAVGESFTKPLDYYGVNVGGTTCLLQQLESANVPHFVFSSSATVYGEPEMLPLREEARLTATNPYGRTKLFIEEVLRDLYASQPEAWNILILRYFNPIGAHPSGRMGEDPQGIPNNLMPFIAQVCVGRREKLSVFGGDYSTPDGTGVRDYIHVVDLAKGHVAALDKLYTTTLGCEAVNLGTGKGVSVLELVEGMAVATGKPVPYEVADRRPGDVAELYADPKKAGELLGWSAELGTTEMCEDTWRWQSTNPMGYRVEEEVVTEN